MFGRKEKNRDFRSRDSIEDIVFSQENLIEMNVKPMEKVFFPNKGRMDFSTEDSLLDLFKVPIKSSRNISYLRLNLSKKLFSEYKDVDGSLDKVYASSSILKNLSEKPFAIIRDENYSLNLMNPFSNIVDGEDIKYLDGKSEFSRFITEKESLIHDSSKLYIESAIDFGLDIASNPNRDFKNIKNSVDYFLSGRKIFLLEKVDHYLKEGNFDLYQTYSNLLDKTSKLNYGDYIEKKRDRLVIENAYPNDLFSR